MFIITLLLLPTFVSPALGDNDCIQIDPCRCRLNNGSEINLHLINGSKQPLLEIKSAGDGHIYTYSPCAGIACGQTVNDAAICRNDELRKSPNTTGEISKAKFENDMIKTNWKLRYLTRDNKTNSVVHLTCATFTRLDLEPMYNATTFQFELYSPCACPDGCLVVATDLSTGTILLLIFLTLFILYFGVGSLYRKSVYGAEGREIVPHTSFWFSLPGLIKDGYLFFISPCLGDRVEYRYYDKL
ncbi:cation-dependent mannose-6-phosphate receptor-like [Haliotis cracherodii]|uniref:cation-dependent mannose-6-phosphate receptor-like n=1 Tax=Haliotis cracherodii TaxID=6455 RepID=UPI0039E85D10